MGVNATRVLEKYPKEKQQLEERYGKEAVAKYCSSRYVLVSLLNLVAGLPKFESQALPYLLYNSLCEAFGMPSLEWKDFAALSLLTVNDVINNFRRTNKITEHFFLHFDEVIVLPS